MEKPDLRGEPLEPEVKNRPFFFISELPQVVCYTNAKLTNTYFLPFSTFCSPHR
jgi:hypothetical protein